MNSDIILACIIDRYALESWGMLAAGILSPVSSLVTPNKRFSVDTSLVDINEYIGECI